MSSAPIPLQYEGDGNFRVTSNYWMVKSDKEYVVGQTYRMIEFEDRSLSSHNHEFAFVAEAWRNLPERFDHEPWAQSPEHLRKHALIMTKFCNTQTYPCASAAEARRWAAYLRPLDEYSVVKAEGNVVHVFTAMSQKMRGMGAMDKATFQASKQAIMDYLDDLIGVARGETARSEAA